MPPPQPRRELGEAVDVGTAGRAQGDPGPVGAMVRVEDQAKKGAERSPSGR